MNILTKKIEALKALENHDKKLSDGLKAIVTACKDYIKDNPVNGSKSENAITKAYHKKVEKVIKALENSDGETTETGDNE